LERDAHETESDIAEVRKEFRSLLAKGVGHE